MNDLRAYLERVVLDDNFRDLARRDPDASFEGFTLSEADRDVLRRQDEAVLGLLGRVLAGPASHAPATEAPIEPGLQRVTLPEIGFLLRVTPTATVYPDGRLQVTCTAHVQPVTLTPIPTTGVPSPAVSPTPWHHHVAGPEVEAAATAVHEAPEEARRDAILGLIGAITRG